ncbi:MAG: TonB family protein [Victivallales bacterium]|nr:TonB family protein [Victivallales bacterium]
MSYANHISRTPVASRIIPVVVVCLHVVVLGAILWGRFLKLEPLKPQPPSMKVELVFAKALDDPGPVSPPIEIEKPKVEIEKPKAEIEKPKAEIEKPKVEIKKPKAEIKKPKAEIKKPKVEIKKPKKKWTLAKVEDIRQRPDFQQVKSRPRTPVVDVDQLTRKFQKAAGGVLINSPVPRPSRAPAETIQQAKFDDAAMRVLGARWSDSFSASELTGSGRTVVVRFTIRSDGSVISKRIVRRSGVPAIDRRAAGLLKAITRFPAPTAYGIRAATYDITCDLVAAE